LRIDTKQAILILVACFLLYNLAGASSLSYTEMDQDQETRGAIRGIVTDRQTGEPVGWASILLEEINRSAIAHEDGRFSFNNIPAGRYTLRTYRLSYENHIQEIIVSAGDTLALELRLMRHDFRSDAVVITAETPDDDLTRPERVISGTELRQQLGRTLAETIGNEPGMSQRSMGPAPARPVLRGLGGDRLLILEDGNRTGDMSATAPDHAVAIDPMNAERIELIRGPAALMYGSNTLGGVINVSRGQIPTVLSEHLHGSGSLQLESVNTGAGSGFNIEGSSGKISLRADLSGRMASDIETATGTLDNSSIETLSGSVGAGYIRSWGVLGLSGNLFSSSYGIPGNFIGSHPNGVRIEMIRRQLHAKADYLPGNKFYKRVDTGLNYNYYYHRELEWSSDSQAFDVIGSEFRLHTMNFTSLAHHNSWGPFRSGMFGVFGEFRDYASGGFTFTPPVREYALAAMLYQQARVARLTIDISARIDFRLTQPEEERESRLIGLMRSREFSGYSAGTRLTYEVNDWIDAGAGFMKTLRLPGLEELYSEGPHLPAYSYDIGNPELDTEEGYGLEIFSRFHLQRLRLEVAAFRNVINNYLYPRNTGLESERRPLPIYQYSGDDVIMSGWELNYDLDLFLNFSTSGSLSYVRGDLADEDRPLPFIPPLGGKINIQYNRADLTIGASVRIAAEQARVGEFEEPTDGYMVYDLFARYLFSSGKFLHTFSFGIDNLTDSDYRMHLSRVKSIMPEPGRNFKLLYRVYF
jgi:iron complex outermembrane recepter protein